MDIPIAPILKVDHVTKRFGAGPTEVVAVRDVSLAVAPGEVDLIMGPSGSGKTTLLLMLGALLRPTEGSIEVNGTAISQLLEHRLPDIRLRQFGFVFQDFNLLSALTTLENVALVAQLAGVKSAVARERAAAVLTQLGLGKRLRFLPDKLSGGEKQRVAIARALVNDPPLILADEPTANLDSKIGHEIMRLLRRIAKEQQRSVVIVSHDQRIRDIADRVLWLEDGQFKELQALVTDPVCGMSLEPERAVAQTWNARTWHFCSKGCRDEFLADPPPLLARPPARVCPLPDICSPLAQGLRAVRKPAPGKAEKRRGGNGSVATATNPASATRAVNSSRPLPPA
jgi:putative ABC transport system ATP-binding protein